MAAIPKRAFKFVGRHWLALVLIVALVGGATFVWRMPNLRAEALSLSNRALAWAGLGGAGEVSDAIYWCPMHPQIKRNDPNEVCPICNMALVLLEGDASAGPADELTLTAQQTQQAGVATETVLRRELYREIDTTGRLEYDETRLARITSWVHGRSRIEELHVNFTGTRVERGELLAELYSPDLTIAAREYLGALDSDVRVPVEGIDLRSSMLNSTKRKLLDQGMTEAQIAELARTREVPHRIPVSSPMSGTVLKRHVQEGDSVTEGEVLLEIADLSRLWLMADVYEEELSSIEIGQSVTITVPSLPGEVFEGKIAFEDPQVQPETRTVRIRIEVDNAERRLKPAMYARVQMRQRFPAMTAVPENAVLWSGQRSVAIVRLGEGQFQPREVRIGRRWLYPAEVGYRPGGSLEFGRERMRYHEILAGLGPGEQVVTAGTFLLNAEAQFQNTLTKMLPPADQPATLEEAIGTEMAAGIRDVLDGYYEITASLAADELEPLAAEANSLAERARRLAERAGDNAMPGLTESAGRVAGIAAEIAAGPADLKEARVSYGRLSRAMFVLLSKNGGQTLLDRDVFSFHCGMAKVGYENWLWWSKEIHNPYMGKKMLDCGTKLKTLEPDAEP